MNVKATLSPDDLARACADAMWKDDDASKGLGMEILQVRAGEARSRGSVGHVGVFRMGGVRTSILERPRRLSSHRRAGTGPDQHYTLSAKSRLMRWALLVVDCEGYFARL